MSKMVQTAWPWSVAETQPPKAAPRALSSAQLFKRWKAHKRLAEQFYALYRAAVGEDKARMQACSDRASEGPKRKARAKGKSTKRKARARASK